MLKSNPFLAICKVQLWILISNTPMFGRSLLTDGLQILLFSWCIRSGTVIVVITLARDLLMRRRETLSSLQQQGLVSDGVWGCVKLLFFKLGFCVDSLLLQQDFWVTQTCFVSRMYKDHLCCQNVPYIVRRSKADEAHIICSKRMLGSFRLYATAALRKRLAVVRNYYLLCFDLWRKSFSAP